MSWESWSWTLLSWASLLRAASTRTRLSSPITAGFRGFTCASEGVLRARHPATQPHILLRSQLPFPEVLPRKHKTEAGLQDVDLGAVLAILPWGKEG